jgi:hypothetical protein
MNAPIGVFSCGASLKKKDLRPKDEMCPGVSL